MTEARHLFKQAESLQRKDQPEFPLLYSLPGFRYCDLILAPAERAAWQRTVEGRASVLDCASPLALSGDGARPEESSTLAGQSGGGPPHSKTLRATAECAAWQTNNSALRIPHSALETALAEAERRATQTLEWLQDQYPLLSIALDHLTLASVALYRVALSPNLKSEIQNLKSPALALDGLRQAGVIEFVAKALLTAAHWHALAGDAATARAHLAEAQQIAERGPMPLYLADVHLHRARLAGREKAEGRMKNWPGVDPRAELAKAKALIEHHHYGRRFAELATTEAALR